MFPTWVTSDVLEVSLSQAIIVVGKYEYFLQNNYSESRGVEKEIEKENRLGGD